MKMNKKGFTLVEIMIVVAIIGVLAAIAIPNFIRYRQTAQKNACIGNLKQIQGAIEQWRMSKGDSNTPADVATLCGSTMYIKVEPKCPASGSGYTIASDAAGNAYPSCGYGSGDLVHVLPDAGGAAAATTGS